MKECKGQVGRVFLIRLEDGDMIPSCIERFAEDLLIYRKERFYYTLVEIKASDIIQVPFVV